MIQRIFNKIQAIGLIIYEILEEKPILAKFDLKQFFCENDFAMKFLWVVFLHPNIDNYGGKTSLGLLKQIGRSGQFTSYLFFLCCLIESIISFF